MKPDPRAWWNALNEDIRVEQEKLRIELRTQAIEERRKAKETYFQELYGGLDVPPIRPVGQKNHWGFPYAIEVDLKGPEAKSLYELMTGFAHESLTQKEQTFMQRRSTIQARLRQLESELAALARFPDDNYDNGTVVKFDRVANRGTEDQSTWSFAAMKWGKVWYLTAQRGKVVSWEGLCELAGDSEIQVASVWAVAVPSKAEFDGETGKTDGAETAKAA